MNSYPSHVERCTPISQYLVKRVFSYYWLSTVWTSFLGEVQRMHSLSAIPTLFHETNLSYWLISIQGIIKLNASQPLRETCTTELWEFSSAQGHSKKRDQKLDLPLHSLARDESRWTLTVNVGQKDYENLTSSNNNHSFNKRCTRDSFTKFTIFCSRKRVAEVLRRPYMKIFRQTTLLRQVYVELVLFIVFLGWLVLEWYSWDQVISTVASNLSLLDHQS